MLGAVAALLLATAALGLATDRLVGLFGDVSTAEFFSAICLRIGLVLAALCLAWESLKRPAAWLPPGLAVAGVVGIAILAAQPRLILVLMPIAGVLLVLGGIIRAFRRPGR